MERTPIRAWRRIQNKRVWRNRLRQIYWAFYTTYVYVPGEEPRKAKTWKELRTQKWCQVYRTTGQPCSCILCTGERYNRLEYKRETARLLRQQMDD